MKENETKKNIASSVILQITTIISGFIIPHVILSLFGSSVNGFVSSVNQFLNYIQLIEGGIGGVVMASLYGPLRQNDESKISGIINAASSFFKKIGIIYIAYLVILSLSYPLLIETGFNYIYSVALIVVLGANLIVQYFFSITYKLLLNADRKVYIVSTTQAIIVILNVVLILGCSVWFKDILFIKLISAAVFLIQPFVFSAYVRKHYNLNKSVKADKNALSQRWVAFGTNFAYFVHTNTDIIMLTVLSSLANVSVYSVYLLIVNALKGLIVSISSAIVPSFGKAFVSGSKRELLNTFDKYEFVICIVSFILFSCGAILIVPFVMLYTKGINDANYNQPIFATLLVLAEFFYCIRDPYVQATSAAGMFGAMAPYAYIEATMNIVLSIILIKNHGIIGVAIGTIVAMIFRMIAQIIIVNKSVLGKSSVLSYFKVFILTIFLVTVYFLADFFVPKTINHFSTWIIYACIVLVMCVVVAIIICRLLYWKTFVSIVKENSKE